MRTMTSVWIIPAGTSGPIYIAFPAVFNSTHTPYASAEYMYLRIHCWRRRLTDQTGIITFFINWSAKKKKERKKNKKSAKYYLQRWWVVNGRSREVAVFIGGCFCVLFQFSVALSHGRVKCEIMFRSINSTLFLAVSCAVIISVEGRELVFVFAWILYLDIRRPAVHANIAHSLIIQTEKNSQESHCCCLRHHQRQIGALIVFSARLFWSYVLFAKQIENRLTDETDVFFF